MSSVATAAILAAANSTLRNLSAMLRIGLISALLLAAAFATGCGSSGPPRAEVSGTVTLNGQPVQEGSINFFPTDGNTGPEAGGEIKDGKYHLPRAKGPVLGRNRVELRSFQKTGRRIQDPTAPQGTFTEEIANVFPKQFNSESTLVHDIQQGKNEIPFDIKSE